MYIQTLFPDVRFELTNCNAGCPDLYDAGTIDGAFVWGGVMEKLKQRNATMLFPAQVLSDWGKPTFNTISARADFAARRPDVLERVAGVIARLDADYLDGASASPAQAELDAAAAGLSYFSFVAPDTMQG